MLWLLVGFGDWGDVGVEADEDLMASWSFCFGELGGGWNNL